MTRAPVALIAIAGVVSFEACTHRGSDAFEREASRIESSLTAPEGTKLLDRSAERRNALQRVQSWQLRAAGTWPSYADGIEGAMAPSYQCSLEGAALRCSRRMPGDVLYLYVESIRDAEGVAIQAELRGNPD